MASKFQLLLFPFFIFLTTHAQVFNPVSLNIGDTAPLLRVGEWLKGKPVKEFERGKVYVIEFWATWCGPCIEEMPRLSALARQSKRTVNVIGVNVYERKSRSAVKVFVDSMAHWMNYTVAVQDSNFMETDWMDATGETTIPTSFVVDAAGRLAWIGYTANLPDALSKIVSNNWDLTAAIAERNTDKQFGKIGQAISKTVQPYNDNRYMTDFYGQPDSALLVIHQMVADHPGLQYERFVAYGTFHVLLRIDPQKAYAYGRELMASRQPSYDVIIESINDFPYQYNTLPPSLFELGAEAYQREIDRYPWTTKTAKNYFKMADWYLLANNKPKAKQAMRKALKALKSKKRKVLERKI